MTSVSSCVLRVGALRALMDVIHFPDDARPAHWVQPVLALGNFDGVHRGHRKILDRVRRVAGERGATSVVMTFDPHPSRVVRPDKAPPLLMTTAQKLEALAAAGLHGAAIVRFTPALSQWDPEMFVRTVLVDWLRVAEVWVGANFLFGHDRTGNFSMLRTARRALRVQGREDRPGALQGLRRQQHADSPADRRGARGRGRRAARPSVLPRRHRRQGRSPRDRRSGFRPPISAPTTSCCRRTASMRRRPGSATSCIRRSPTSASGRRSTPAGRPTVETHIFNFDRDLYGASIRVGFVQRLRDERAFESLDLLKAQIAADCAGRGLFDRFRCRIAWPITFFRVDLRCSAMLRRGAGADGARRIRRAERLAALRPRLATQARPSCSSGGELRCRRHGDRALIAIPP